MKDPQPIAEWELGGATTMLDFFTQWRAHINWEIPICIISNDMAELRRLVLWSDGELYGYEA